MAEDPETYDALARHYHEEVLTPFLPGVGFRLAGDLRGLLGAWRRDGSLARRVAVDFGCGCGEALEMIAGKVGLAAGLDFSPGMLDVAAERLGGRAVERYDGRGGARWLRRRIEAARDPAPGTLLVRGDLRRLDALAGRVDLALAINSLCPTTQAAAERLFANVAATLAPGGRLFAVFPSIDTIEYLLDLERRGDLVPSAPGRVEPGPGIFIYPDGHRQKQWRPEEIEAATRRARLRVVRLEKVRYPWELARRYGYGWFPEEAPLWDWYLEAADRR